MQFLENVPLAPYTTFGVGGPARWFAEAVSEEEVLEGLAFARTRSLQLFVLGGGSNLLVADEGFNGLVLRIALRGCKENNPGQFFVAAGEDWDGFVSLAVSRDCAGVECLAGIPGSVGGTPVQNVGAYGQEVAETVRLVRAVDLRSGAVVELGAAECGFAYRRSIFNSTERGRYAVTRVDFDLTLGGAPRIAYADLKRHFAGQPTPTLTEVSAAVREIRRGKGMLLTADDPDCRSAGSFFKNPVISKAHYAQIAAATATAVPQYPAGDAQVKLPAAWLLEQAGFTKGYAMGQAGISSRHTLALINRGGATAAAIGALRDRIITVVQDRFGIVLEPEPVWLG